jgi:hypothetical protein
MLPALINHNLDLKRLWDEGLELEIIDAYLLVHHIPYLNSLKEIKYGTLVSFLHLAGEKVLQPDTHVVYFMGETPCGNDGSSIRSIINSSEIKKLQENIVVNHLFSSKPNNGYVDYFEKMMTYIGIISAPAKSLDDSVTEKTHKVVESKNSESVFNFPDTNSAKAEINIVSQKLSNLKVAIIGLGGTGSYILDLIAKTPVQEIHLFDGDTFKQHNAFRAPGAPSIELLREREKKTDYFKNIYSNMHRKIIPHSIYIDASNIDILSGMDFVFLSLDKCEIKKTIINHLKINNISFIDVGMGLHLVDDSLIGILRVTSGTSKKIDHIEKRISFSDEGENEYSKNIQIADLNALNATLAVIKWKKIFNYYQDLLKENNTTYTINTGQLINEDNDS